MLSEDDHRISVLWDLLNDPGDVLLILRREQVFRLFPW